jgi:hypothetical protein
MSSTTAQLTRLEQIVDSSGIAREIELLLPVGVRPRQLRVRTLLAGMLLVAVEGRPAHLRRIHHALSDLPDADQHRLAVIAQWKTGPHQLTYRQLERTFALVTRVLSKDTPDGAPSQALSHVLDALLEASVTVLDEPPSSSYAVDWTDLETWSRPPPKPRPASTGPASSDPDSDSDATTTTTTTSTNDGDTSTSSSDGDTTTDGEDGRRRCADPEAAWGHRNTNHPARNEMFHGYHLQAITSVRDEHGPEVPELARRMHLASCAHDPPAQIVPVLQRMHASGITIGDLLADSGYAYRIPHTWALPLRQLGIDPIQDLHPADRGPHGTHNGATCSNGNLYCPATPSPLLDIGPLARGATTQQTATHDQQSAELARYKLSPITSYNPDGYRRVICPAAQQKLRCPHKPSSLTLPHDRPTVHQPPEHPPACCTQQTITVPPTVNAKTAQKHDYPSPQHRTSYNRRTAAERTFATITDPATNDIARGWCRLTGLAPIALLTATVLIARNLRIADAFTARQTDNEQRAANGLSPKQRRRRRQTTNDLTSPANAPP